MKRLDIGLVICILLHFVVAVHGIFRSYSPFFVDTFHWQICPNGDYAHSRCRPEFKYDCKQGYTCIKQHNLIKIDNDYCGICCRAPRGCPHGQFQGPSCSYTPCPMGYTCNHGTCCLAPRSVCPTGSRPVSKCKNYYGCRYGAICVHGTCCAGANKVQVCPNDHYPLPGIQCNKLNRCPGTSSCYRNRCCQSKFKQTHPQNKTPPTFRRKLPPLLFVKPRPPHPPPNVVHKVPVDTEIIIHTHHPTKPTIRKPVVPPNFKAVSCPLGFKQLPGLTCTHLSACPGTSECISGICCSKSVMSVCPVDHILIPQINCNLRQRCPQNSKCVAGVCCIPPSCPSGYILDPSLSCDQGGCAGHGTCISGSCCIDPTHPVTEPPVIIELPRLPPAIAPRRLPVISTKAPIILTMAPLPVNKNTFPKHPDNLNPLPTIPRNLNPLPTFPVNFNTLPTPIEPRVKSLPKVPNRHVPNSGPPNTVQIIPRDRSFPNQPVGPAPNPDPHVHNPIPSVPLFDNSINLSPFLPSVPPSLPPRSRPMLPPNTPLNGQPPQVPSRGIQNINVPPTPGVIAPAGPPVGNVPNQNGVPNFPGLNFNISDFFPPNTPQFPVIRDLLPIGTPSGPVGNNQLPPSGVSNPPRPTGSNVPASAPQIPTMPDWSRLIEALYPNVPTKPPTAPAGPSNTLLPQTPRGSNNLPSQPPNPGQTPTGTANLPNIGNFPLDTFPSLFPNLPNLPGAPGVSNPPSGLFGPGVDQVPSQPVNNDIPNIPLTFPDLSNFPPLFPDITDPFAFNATVPPLFPNDPLAPLDVFPALPSGPSISPTGPPTAPSVSFKTAPPMLPFEPLFNITPNFSLPTVPDLFNDLFGPTFPPNLPSPVTQPPKLPAGPPVNSPNLPTIPRTNPTPANVRPIPTTLPTIFPPGNPTNGFIPSFTQPPPKSIPSVPGVPNTKASATPAFQQLPALPTTLPTFVVPKVPAAIPTNVPNIPLNPPVPSAPTQSIIPTQPPINIPQNPTLPNIPTESIVPFNPPLQPVLPLVPQLPGAPTQPTFNAPLNPQLPTVPSFPFNPPQASNPSANVPQGPPVPNTTMPPIIPGPAILQKVTMPPFTFPEPIIPRPPPTQPPVNVPPPPIFVPLQPPTGMPGPPSFVNQPVKIPPPPPFELPPPPATVVPVPTIPTFAPPTIPRPPPIFTFKNPPTIPPPKRPIIPPFINTTATLVTQTRPLPNLNTTMGFPDLPISLFDPTISPFNFTLPPLNPLAPIIPPYVEPPVIPPATLAPVIPPGVPSPAGPTFPPFIATFNSTLTSTAPIPVNISNVVTPPIAPPLGNQPILPIGVPTDPAFPLYDVTFPPLFPMTTPFPLNPPLNQPNITDPINLFNTGPTQPLLPLFPPVTGPNPAFNFTIPPLNPVFPSFGVTASPTNFTLPPLNNTFTYFNDTLPYFNDTVPYNDTFPAYYDYPVLNDTFPYYYDTFPLVNETFRPLNDTFPPVNNTFPLLNDTYPPYYDTFPTSNDTFPQTNWTIPPVRDIFPPLNNAAPVLNSTTPSFQQLPQINQTNPIPNVPNPIPKIPTAPLNVTPPPVNGTNYFDNTTLPYLFDAPFNSTFPANNFTYFDFNTTSNSNSSSFFPTTPFPIHNQPPNVNITIPTQPPPLLSNQTEGYPFVDYNTTLPPTLWVTLTPVNTSRPFMYPTNETFPSGGSNNTIYPWTTTSKYIFNLTFPSNTAPTTYQPITPINTTDTPTSLTPPSPPASCPDGNITIPGLYCDKVFKCPTGSSCYYGFCCLPYEMVQIPACLVDFVVTPVCPQPPEADQCRYDRECGPFMTCCLNSCDRRVCRPTVNPKPSKPR